MNETGFAEGRAAGADLLVSSLPRILRARGWRLYAADGRRFLDLWSEGGGTAAGRRRGGQGRLAKELLDRGLVSALPSFWGDRLAKALSSWLPGYVEFRFYGSKAELLVALGDRAARLGREGPFGSYLPDRPEADLALVDMPLASAWSFVVLGGRSRAALDGLPPSDLLPPIRLALAAKAVAEMAAYEAEVGEKLWSRFDRRIGGLFGRRGPWLLPLWPRERHPEAFRACLDSGLLISPDYDQPSLIPGEFDEGEIAALGKLARF